MLVAVGPVVVSGGVDDRMPNASKVVESAAIPFVSARAPHDVAHVHDEVQLSIVELIDQVLEVPFLQPGVGSVAEHGEGEAVRRVGLALDAAEKAEEDEDQNTCDGQPGGSVRRSYGVGGPFGLDRAAHEVAA